MVEGRGGIGGAIRKGGEGIGVGRTASYSRLARFGAAGGIDMLFPCKELLGLLLRL